MILDHPIISQRYFFPRSSPLQDATPVDCGEATLACYRLDRHVDAPTVVHFHGNGEIVADYLPDFAEALLDLGVNVFFAEYRGYGGSTGEPALAAMLADIVPIHQAIGLPPERLIPFGRSVGSIYAIEYVQRYPRCAGLILESGIADPLQRVLLRVTPEELGTTAEALASAAAESLDHQAKLGGYHGPVLVMHTAHDGLVDVSHAARNASWTAGDRTRLLVFPDGDHNSIMATNWLTYLQALAEFFEGKRP